MNATDRSKAILSAVLISFLSLSGCTPQDHSSNITQEPVRKLSKETKVDDSQIKDIIDNEVKQELTTAKPTLPETPQSNTFNNDEELVVQYFENQENSVREASKTKDKEEIKKQATNYLKTATDFFFHGKEINGMTLKELSAESIKEIKISISDTKDILDDSGITDVAVDLGEGTKKITFEILEFTAEAIPIVGRDLMGEKLYNKVADVTSDFYKESSKRITKSWEDIKQLYQNR